jgi:hypothetical protein
VPRPALPAEPQSAPQLRSLTPGEAAIAWEVFGPALDLAPVMLRREKWAMWQPASVTMAPDGHIWFHPNGDRWSDDFSAEHPVVQHLLVHELVHVWQHQQGIRLPLRRHPFCRYAYAPLAPGRPFRSYGIEQQAEIVADAWVAFRGYPRIGRPPFQQLAALIPFWNAGGQPLLPTA